MYARFLWLLLLISPLTAYGVTVKTPASESPYVFINRTDTITTCTPIQPNGLFGDPIVIPPGQLAKIGSISILELVNVVSKTASHRSFFIRFADDKLPSFVVHFKQYPVSNKVNICIEQSADPLNAACIKKAPEKEIYHLSFKNIDTDVLALNNHLVKTRTFQRFGTIGLPEVQLIVQ